MKKFYECNKKTINQLVVFSASLACVYLFFKYIFGLVLPFLAALLLSKVISVPVDISSRKFRIHRGFPTIISMAVILVVLGGAINLFAGILIGQLMQFSGDFPLAYDASVNLIKGFRQTYDNFFEILPADVGVFFEDTIMTMVPEIISSVGKFARTWSVSFVKVLPKILVFIIITLIATFFITKDKQIIFGFFKRQIPVKVINIYRLIKDDIFSALWGYIRAQLILMCVSGTISIIGLSIMGYPYALLLGVTIAVFDMLPIFGPGFILWPWTLITVLSGQYKFATGLFILYIVVIVCRQFLEPKVLSSQIGLYPLVTLASVYIGLMVLGPFGIVAGPVLIITVRSLQKAKMLPDFK